ncbi:TPA_asm: D-alanyl-D-alanine carboxypeptidase, partial [Listeria monocytogenes]|nr:D-alanyl-D-alanine carboxypeptidase [Listeria monocytogenes]
VSPSIKAGVTVNESKTTTFSSKSKGLDVMWLFCFLPAGILYLIFKQTDPKRRK